MKRVLVGLVVLCSMAAVVNAQEDTTLIPGVTTTFDLTYTTKYIWRGIDLLDDASAWQPSVNFDFGNGFSANVWASYAGTSGNSTLSRVNATEYNYTLAYSGTLYEACPWSTDYTVGWRYYDFIDEPSDMADMQEVFVEVAMPELVGGGVTPHAAYYQMWEAKNNSQVSGAGGAIFVLGFTYDFTLEQAPELPMTFGWDIVYNDGAAAVGVDHDWTHMVWSLGTSMTCPMTGATITPAVYFQNSFEDTVNNEDEFWASLSYSFNF